MSQFPRLTTTSYAILGLVAAEPASAYALVRRMRINYRYFWPRARSLVYTEVKKLEGLGWVVGVPETTGRRKRLEYAITATGRAELARWLGTPSTAFALELEALVRVYLARFGSERDLLAAITSMAAEAEVMLDIAGEIIPAYLAGTPPPPADLVHHRAVLFDFLTGFAAFVQDWADRSSAEVESWAGCDPAALEARALKRMRGMPMNPSSAARRR